MEKERYQDLKAQWLSKQEIFSLAKKEELVANLQLYAHMKKAQDGSINQALQIEQKRLDSYTNNTSTASSNYLVEQQKRNKATAAIKLFYLLATLDKRHRNYQKEQQAYSPKAQSVAHKIAQESGWKVQCVVDKEFIEAFGDLLGTKYRWSALMGKRVIARDEKVLEDEWLMRHEAIHCMQQRDLNDGEAWRIWFIKWLKLSGESYAWLRKELQWSSDVANYATQNQLSERETYVNQLNPEYLSQRTPNAWLDAATPEGRKNIVASSMEQEKINYQKQIDILMQQYYKEPDTYKKMHIIQQVEDLKKFFVLQKKLDPEDWKYFIILKDEIPEHLNDPSFQIKFETEDNREKRNTLQHERNNKK